MKYKLIAHVINGEVAILTGQGLQAIKEPILIADIDARIPEGYVDITSILNWDTVGMDYAESVGLDYIFVDDRIIEVGRQAVFDNSKGTFNSPSEIPDDDIPAGFLVIVGDKPTDEFENQAGNAATYDGTNWVFDTVYNTIIDYVPDEEKLILVAHNIGRADKFLAVPGVTITDMYNQHADAYEQRTKSRECRMIWAVGYIVSEVPHYQAKILVDILNSPLGDLHKLYTIFNVVGSLETESALPGIIDYLYAREPFFTTTGLIVQDFEPTTSRLSKQTFIDRLAQVLVDGITYYYEGIVT